jgi:hypothetical protein
MTKSIYIIIGLYLFVNFPFNHGRVVSNPISYSNSALKMQEACSPEMLVFTYRLTQRQNPEKRLFYSFINSCPHVDTEIYACGFPRTCWEAWPSFHLLSKRSSNNCIRPRHKLRAMWNHLIHIAWPYFRKITVACKRELKMFVIQDTPLSNVTNKYRLQVSQI